MFVAVAVGYIAGLVGWEKFCHLLRSHILHRKG